MSLFSRSLAPSGKIAEEHQVPPYVIFSTEPSMRCRYFPATLPDMRRISGVGDAKLERYGKILSGR